MGSCVGKKKTQPQTQEPRLSELPTIDGADLMASLGTRKRLSIYRPVISGEILSPQGFTQVSQTAASDVAAGRSVPTSPHAMMVYGQHSPKRQEQYDDKTPCITGAKVTLEQVALVGVAVACKKGLKSESPNQDDYCIIFQNPTLIFGVFDGHGDFGHYVSEFVHINLPCGIRDHPKTQKNPKKAMSECFVETNKALIKLCEQKDCLFNCNFSGTTATIALVKEDKLILGHVGDSRAVIGRRTATGTMYASPLTHDHKPSLPSERSRILAKHGEVRIMPDDCDYRVFCKGKDYPGLAMTRAIGDLVAQDIGVTSEPDVAEYQITPEDEFLLICTDGVWEFITNEEAVSIVAEQGRGNVRKGAEKLCQVAYNQWAQKCHNLIDDITVLVAYLPKPGTTSYADFIC